MLGMAECHHAIYSQRWSYVHIRLKPAKCLLTLTPSVPPAVKVTVFLCHISNSDTEAPELGKFLSFDYLCGDVKLFVTSGGSTNQHSSCFPVHLGATTIGNIPWLLCSRVSVLKKAKALTPFAHVTWCIITVGVTTWSQRFLLNYVTHENKRQLRYSRQGICTTATKMICFKLLRKQ